MGDTGRRPRRRGIRGGLAALGLCLACPAGSAVASDLPQQASAVAPAQVVTRTATGTHVIGAATAHVRLVEFVSYTCPYCAIYEMYAAPFRAERLEKSGVLSVEVRHVIHDSVDLATALLARCGADARFFERHNAYMHRQRVTLSAITPELEQAWRKLPLKDQMPRIAQDTGLLEFAATLGTTDAEAAACLGNATEIQTLQAMTEAAARQGGETVPGFVLNGKLLVDIHSWAGVRNHLDRALLEAGGGVRKPGG
ncbi:DsbA family protein [Sphingomonas sp. CJ20]